MDALIPIGINLLLSAALWGLGLLLRKKTRTEGPRVEDRNVQISTYGAPKPILYGRCKTAMELIWATKLREHRIEHEVGKGGGGSSYTEYKYSCSWAGMFGIAPDESVFGEMKLLKLWIDSKLAYNALADSDKVVAASAMKKFKFYSGSATQLPDSVIEASLGSDNVPAYRYRCYGLFNDLNVTPYGNRIPTTRALVAPGTVSQVNMVMDVPGYTGDGNNRERFYSLQTIMAEDESYIICVEWVYGPACPETDYKSGTYFYKISTHTKQQISSKFFSGEAGDEWCDYLCDFACGSYNDPFGWHHPATLDELGRVYSFACAGYGRCYRLNSDTWTIEARSPEYPNDSSILIRDIGTDASEWSFYNTRVSRNPLYPYLYATPCSVEQGNLGPQAVVLIDRETMASPFDSSRWAHIFWSPNGPTLTEPGHTCPGAHCIDARDCSCYALWTDVEDPVNAWLSHLYPDGGRIDVEITAYMPTDPDDWSSLWAHIAYDPDSDQLILCGNDGLATYAWFFDGDLNYVDKVAFPDYIPYLDGNNGEDNFHRGVVGGKLYVTGWYDDPATVYQVDIASHTITAIYAESLASLGGTLINATYCSYRNSIFIEIIYEDDYDSVLKELLLGRLTLGSVYLDDIVQDVALRAGLIETQINVSDLEGVEVKGYLVAQDQSARETLEPLMEAFIFDGMEVDGVLTFVRRGGASVVTIPESDLAAFVSERPEPLSIEYQDEIADLPRRTEVHYPNIGRNHEAGIQHYQRQVTDSKLIKEIQTPILMDDDDAKQLAHIAFKYDWETYPVELSLGPKYSRLTPLDVVTVQKSEGDYRVLLLEANRQGLLTNWKGLIEELTYTSDLDGSPSPDIDEDVDFAGPSIYYLLDTPPLLDSHDQAAVYVASGALFEDWAGCSIYDSKDSGETWQYFVSTPERAMTGVAITALNDHSSVVRDRHSTLTVRWDYSGDALASVTESQLLQGQGHYMAIIKSDGNIEVICAKTVVTNEDGTQSFTDIIRGVKGTDYAMSDHAAGEKVIRLNTTTIFLKALDSTYLNQSYLYNGISSGDEWEDGSKKVFTTTLNTLVPWSGVQPRGVRDVSNNLTITWKRRNRIYGLNELLTGNEIPMSETAEDYEVDVYDNGTVVRTIDSLSSESASYSAAEQTADGLTPGDPVHCKIYQISSVVGRGRYLDATV